MMSTVSGTIVFESATAVLAGEGCSKRLAAGSPLVLQLEMIRNRVAEKFPVCRARPWHIELIRKQRGTTREHQAAVLVERAAALEGRRVDLCQSSAWDVMADRALVLNVGQVPGYGSGHVTVAYVKTDARLSSSDVEWVKAQVRFSAEGAASDSDMPVVPDELAPSVDLKTRKVAPASAAAGAGTDVAEFTSEVMVPPGLTEWSAVGLRERLAILQGQLRDLEAANDELRHKNVNLQKQVSEYQATLREIESHRGVCTCKLGLLGSALA
jgi:hypothetical protein